MSTLTVDLDTTGDYTFKFENLLAQKYGNNLDYIVKANGNSVDKKENIVLNDSSTTEYVLTITEVKDEIMGILSREFITQI